MQHIWCFNLSSLLSCLTSRTGVKNCCRLRILRRSKLLKDCPWQPASPALAGAGHHLQNPPPMFDSIRRPPIHTYSNVLHSIYNVLHSIYKAPPGPCTRCTRCCNKKPAASTICARGQKDLSCWPLWLSPPFSSTSCIFISKISRSLEVRAVERLQVDDWVHHHLQLFHWHLVALLALLAYTACTWLGAAATTTSSTTSTCLHRGTIHHLLNILQLHKAAQAERQESKASYIKRSAKPYPQGSASKG